MSHQSDVPVHKIQAAVLRKKGVALHFITEKLDTDSAVGDFLFTLTACLLQMERKLTGKRNKKIFLDSTKPNV